MVGDDDFDVTGLGNGDTFSEKNLVLLYRFSLEIEKARSMFGRNTRRSDDVVENLNYSGGDEGGDGNNNQKLPHTEESPEFPTEQGTECSYVETF